MSVVVIDIKDLKRIISETVNDAMKHQKKDIKAKTEFLTRKQVAEVLGLCLATVDNWTKQGRLIVHRNGKTVRYKKSEVLAAMETIEKYKK